MTDRERLIELIKTIEENPEITCPYQKVDPDCENCEYQIKKFLCDVRARKADFILSDGWKRLPCNVGDKVAVRACCECVQTIPDNDECRYICPFEDDCECDDCDNANERIFNTEIDSIFNNGFGWKITFKNLGLIEANFTDIGVSFFVGENAEQQAKEYEKALAERQVIKCD